MCQEHGQTTVTLQHDETDLKEALSLHSKEGMVWGALPGYNTLRAEAKNRASERARIKRTAAAAAKKKHKAAKKAAAQAAAAKAKAAKAASAAPGQSPPPHTPRHFTLCFPGWIYACTSPCTLTQTHTHSHRLTQTHTSALHTHTASGPRRSARPRTFRPNYAGGMGTMSDSGSAGPLPSSSSTSDPNFSGGSAPSAGSLSSGGSSAPISSSGSGGSDAAPAANLAAATSTPAPPAPAAKPAGGLLSVEEFMALPQEEAESLPKANKVWESD